MSKYFEAKNASKDFPKESVNPNRNPLRPTANKPIIRRTPLKRYTSSRMEEMKVYALERDTFLNKFPECQVQLAGCMYNASAIHHLFSGKDRRSHYMDTATWVSICVSCHAQIHDHLSADQVAEIGLKHSTPHNK